MNDECKEIEDKIKVANILLQDCNKKLAAAVKTGNWDETRVVQIMLEAATKDSVKLADKLRGLQKQKTEVCEKQKARVKSTASKRTHSDNEAKSRESPRTNVTDKSCEKSVPGDSKHKKT